MEFDIVDAIAKVKAYKQYLTDTLRRIAEKYTYEDFKQELNEWNGTKFIDWAYQNDLEVIYDDETKEIGLRSRIDEDLCVKVSCFVSMAETMYKATEEIKKEK